MIESKVTYENIAIRDMKSLIDEFECMGGVPDHDYISALKVAILALEKRIPKKVTSMKMVYFIMKIALYADSIRMGIDQSIVLIAVNHLIGVIINERSGMCNV